MAPIPANDPNRRMTAGVTAPFGRPARGFLLGKFMPPHAGHQHLCDFARAYCEDLTILVCSLEREPIPGHLRAAWMRELYPDCRVVHFSQDVPQEPDDHPDFWDIWRTISRGAHPEPVDVVFASEPYGARLAQELEARFVPVDPGRETQPISGTAVRAAPFRHWHRLPAPVRAWYAPKVCLFGPESTGKTTLARRLAEHFATVVAPEYGRTYTEVFGTEVNAEDLIRIAAGHQAGVAAAARAANRILICDTDPVLTAVWSRMLIDRPLPQLEAFDDLCDLYLLTDVDAPWIDDGTRYFPDDDTRRRFFDLCKAELDRRGAAYVTLGGSWDERFETAVAAILGRWPDL